MSELSVLSQKVADLTTTVNSLISKIKKTDDFNHQNNLNASSKIRVFINGTSEYITVQQIIDSAILSNYNAGLNGIVSGTLEYIGGLSHRTKNLVYRFNNVLYYSNGFTLTSNVGGAKARKDVYYGDIDLDGQLYILEGDEADAPSVPLLEWGHQLQLTVVDIDAAATEPSGVTNIKWYDDNLQEAGGEKDTTTPNPTNVTLDSIEQASIGIKSVKIIDKNSFKLNSSTKYFGKDLSNVLLDVYLKTSIDNNFILQLFDNGTQKVGEVYISHGIYNFDASLINQWQTLIIPGIKFRIGGAWGDEEYDSIVFNNNKSGSTVYLDNIRIQQGTSTVSVPVSHTHTNLSLLESLTQEKFDYWDGKVNAEDLLNLKVTNVNRIISGQVVWTKIGFKFKSVDLVYEFNGQIYTSNNVEITLTDAAADFGRLDTIYVNIDGLQFITGVPSATPAEQNLDSATQIKTNLVFVPALAVEPDNTSFRYETIYRENVLQAGGEWDGYENTGGLRFNLNNTVSPISQTKDIKGVALNNYDKIIFSKASYIQIDDFNHLAMKFKSLANWSKDTLDVYFLKDGLVVAGSFINKNNLDTSNNTIVQDVILLKESFSYNSLIREFNQIQFNIRSFKSNTILPSASFQLDEIFLQLGSGTVPPEITIHSHSNFEILETITQPLSPVAFSGAYTDLTGKPNIIAVEHRYLSIDELLADQANQTNMALQYVDDASGDPTVTSGYAYYEYLGTTLGTRADYRKLSEQESMDLVPITASEVKVLYESNANTNPFTDADKNNLDLSKTHAESVHIQQSDVNTAETNAKSYADGLITQIIDGAPADGNTLKELNDKILAVQAIIGGTTADGDTIVNTVAELLAVFSTYTEGVDLVTLLAGKLNTTDIYNALDCIVAGKVLDARQGKVLKDLIDALTLVVNSKEPANANIQAHIDSAHAPSNAQKNSDITKAEIDAKLTGELTSHTHIINGVAGLQDALNGINTTIGDISIALDTINGQII